MVIDNSGFLVMHPSFVESKGLYFEDRLFHITNLVGTLNIKVLVYQIHIFLLKQMFLRKKRI